MSASSFYKSVVPLNRDDHRTLRLRTDAQATFAAGVHFVPLAAIEMYEAAREYPIVFAGGEDANPVAVLGLRAGENLYVESDGRWAKGAYVPVFIRRYPFILSPTSPESTDFVLCIDESFDGFSETEGLPLFDEDGKESEVVTRALDLLRDALTEGERTRRFVARLKELDLLTVQSMQVKDPAGRTFAMQDFRVVDENKLKALDNDVLGELHRAGYLGCIYAHLVSLGNVTRLAVKVPMEEGGPAAAAGPAG